MSATAAPAAKPTTASAQPSATSTSPSGGRAFTVLGSGAVLLHDALWAQAKRDARAAGKSGYDFDPLFASLKPVIAAADLAVCHLETPVGPPNGPFSSYPIFSVPPQVVPTLANLGYDTCSTASNHSLDTGERGIGRTLDALDAADIQHTGTARSSKEARRVNMLTVNGVKVAQLSYTFSFNGLRLPHGKDWLANYLRADDVLAAAKRAKRAGAEVVIVSIHWGSEYRQTPNGHQLSLARQLLASPDIDLILGHHAHVVQPLEKIGHKWVAYGMGNQVAWQNFSDVTRDGIMPRFTFTEVKPGSFRVTRGRGHRAAHVAADGVCPGLRRGRRARLALGVGQSQARLCRVARSHQARAWAARRV